MEVSLMDNNYKIIAICSIQQSDAELAMEVLRLVRPDGDLENAARKAAVAVLLCYLNRLSPSLGLFPTRKDDHAKEPAV